MEGRARKRRSRKEDIKAGARSLVCLQSCPILHHCYGPLRAVDGSYAPYKPSALLTVYILSTYEACISLLHQGTVCYG